MVVFKTISDLRKYLDNCRADGKAVNFIPTMGALHKGHISLLTEARKDDAITVTSIFVNPTQFNDKQDFIKYPSTYDKDITLLADAGCDVVFYPGVEEMYPGGSDNVKVYDFGELERVIEGYYRPGHFKGVGQIVGRLLDIVAPDKLFLGQKDYQQCLIIAHLVAQRGDKAQVVICPTVREDDGLAMSSRNLRLTNAQRAVAGTIYQCLVSIQAKAGIPGDFAVVKKECEEILMHKGLRPEYVILADADTLEVFEDYMPGRNTMILIAAFLGDVRLIDNMRLEAA